MIDQTMQKLEGATAVSSADGGSSPLVSIVIPTKDREEAVADCVRSVFAGSYQHFELFVIDQSAGDDTCARLSEFRDDDRFHYHTNRRPGYSAASSRNIGLALSSSDIIAVIDDDVVVEPDWLSTLVREFCDDPELDFICGRLAAPPYDPGTGYTPEFNPHGLGGQSPFRGWRFAMKVAGANFSMRRRLINRVGGYDEFCGPGSRLRASDDGDFFFRVIRSGVKWKGVSKASVVHKYGFRPGDAGADLFQRYQHGIGGNFGRFTRRGDILAGLWFLSREVLQVMRVARTLHIREQGRQELLSSRQRLVGFWRGLLLSPKHGFVSGKDLKRIRRQWRELSVAAEGVSGQPEVKLSVPSSLSERK